MKNNNYYKMLLLVMLSLFGTIIMLPKQNMGLFINEFYLLMLLLIFAGIGFFSIANNIRLGNLLFALFFAVITINGIYLYLNEKTHLLFLILLVFFSVIGLYRSVANIDNDRCNQTIKKEQKIPKTIIVDSIEDKKTQKKKVSTKKKVSKTTKKKIKKKSTKKKSKKTTKKNKK
jgi:hypothetical protein